MTSNDAGGLERSCGRVARDRISIGASRPGFERLHADFTSFSFAAHRHDTYAIGITLRGVQSFGYRGARRRSLAGDAFVLHPDELHDGRAGTAGGFAYAILYVEPRLIQDALGSPIRPLPFVGEAVVGDGRLHAAIRAAFADWDEAAEDLRFDEVMARLAHALASLDRAIPRRPLGRVSARAAGLAREFLDANCLRPVASETLERITGISRFALARHFRACFGTSPHRYAVMRRLDHARSLLRAGVPLAQAAQDSAFADQSHMTRHFKNAYGVAPASWRALSR